MVFKRILLELICLKQMSVKADQKHHSLSKSVVVDLVASVDVDVKQIVVKKVWMNHHTMCQIDSHQKCWVLSLVAYCS